MKDSWHDIMRCDTMRCGTNRCATTSMWREGEQWALALGIWAGMRGWGVAHNTRSRGLCCPRKLQSLGRLLIQSPYREILRAPSH